MWTTLWRDLPDVPAGRPHLLCSFSPSSVLWRLASGPSSVGPGQGECGTGEYPLLRPVGCSGSCLSLPNEQSWQAGPLLRPDALDSSQQDLRTFTPLAPAEGRAFCNDFSLFFSIPWWSLKPAILWTEHHSFSSNVTFPVCILLPAGILTDAQGKQNSFFKWKVSNVSAYKQKVSTKNNLTVVA